MLSRGRCAGWEAAGGVQVTARPVPPHLTIDSCNVAHDISVPVVSIWKSRADSKKLLFVEGAGEGNVNGFSQPVVDVWWPAEVRR